MNAEHLAELLRQTTAQVLEEAIYAFVEQDDAAPDAEVTVIEGWVPFTGVYNGTLAVEIEASSAAQIAGDFLGCDEEPDARNEALYRDVVGELANIVVGRLLERWMPNRVDYDVGTPVVACGPRRESRSSKEPKVCRARFVTDAGARLSAAILLGAGP